MSIFERVLDILPGWRSVRTAGEVSGIMPPQRTAAAPRVDYATSLTLPSVFRAVQILTTSVQQLSLDVEKQDEILGRTPSLVRRPNLDMSRSEWLARIIECLAFTGNAFLLREKAPDGSTINLPILNPHHVHINEDPRTGRLTYWHKGTEYTSREIEHIKFLPPLPGQHYGRGPIQAAQGTMRSALDMNDYMSRWFNDTGQPTGILSSKQKLSADQARSHRNAWNGLKPDGTKPENPAENPSGVKVLDADTTYQPILISPKDALWMDAQAWTTTDIARLFGVPSSLMLVALEGNSLTYANVDQEWLGFLRFTLMGYLKPIEEALTELSPNGQKVRFNVEALLRTDTKSRYDGHAVALSNGFMTVNEVRSIEGLAPIAGGDTLNTTTPSTAEELNDA